MMMVVRMMGMVVMVAIRVLRLSFTLDVDIGVEEKTKQVCE